MPKQSGRRDLVDTGRAKTYAKRDEQGRFREMDAVGRSLPSDRRQSAKRSTKPGYGDRGDRKR